MEYKRDLIMTHDRSVFRLMLGIFSCLISIIWIIARLADNEVINLFDWLYSGFFTLTGLIHIITGLGISIERFFGKAFVHIDNELIHIKLGIFEKEYKIDWQEIKSVEFKLGNFTIQKRDNSSIYFPLSKVGYSHIIGIKDSMYKLAEGKNIQCNIH